MKMLNQNETERVSRYLDGIANSSDTDWVEGLFSNGHKNQNLQNYLELDWENMLQKEQIDDADLNAILDQIHHHIRKNESKNRITPIRRMANLYSKIAAILLVPIIIAGSIYLYYLNGSSGKVADQQVSSVIYAPMGSRVSFNLPDGTSGWLNSGSKLSYSLPFNNKRKVALEGEAWFDVLHNVNQPFEISAGKSIIKVLGTSFNVCAYPKEKYVEVVLQNGRVEFSDQLLEGRIALKPFERLVLKDTKLELNHVDPSKYKGWTDGKLIFRGDNMAEVARRIERWYDVKVEIADIDLLQFSFRATFVDDSLEEVLKLISMTSPIYYKVLPRRQLQDGTYEKEKIVLQKRRK